MEQLTLFDLQNDLSTGSLCDSESGLSSKDAAALVLSEIEKQELREAYTRTLAHVVMGQCWRRSKRSAN